MSEDQHIKIEALNQCSFLPGSYQKRFVRDMGMRPMDYELSEKQTAYLDKLYWQYRKQISGLSREYPEPIRPITQAEKDEALEQLERWNGKVGGL